LVAAAAVALAVQLFQQMRQRLAVTQHSEQLYLLQMAALELVLRQAERVEALL
jgi:hypothetical protein